MVFLLLLATIILGWWLIFKIRYWHMEKLAGKIPGDKPLPIIGNALKLFSVKNVKELVEVIKVMISKYECFGIAKGWIGPVLLVGIWEPKYIEAVADSPNAEQKGSFYIHLLGDVFRGVFVVPGGAVWKELRKPLMKLQAKKILLNEYHDIFLKKNKKFIEYLKEERCGKEINIISDLRHLTFEIISETHFGVKVDEVRNPRFFWLENLDRFVSYTGTAGPKNLIQFIKIFKTIFGKPKSVDKSINDMLNYSKWVFEERKKHLVPGVSSDDKEFYPDFLIKRGEEKNMPKEESYRELSDLISGGGDTTSVTLASALVFLAMFPEIQDEAYQEQVSIFGKDTTRGPTVDDLASMEFIGRCIKETLRIVGPYTFFKYSTDDVNIGDYIIPKGTTIAVFTEMLHLNKKYWEKPDEFFPDHFLPEMEASRPHYAYIPFGYGLRICPGVQYATNSMKTVLSFILRNFKVHTNLKYEDCSYDYRFMRVLTSDYMVTLEERKD